MPNATPLEQKDRRKHERFNVKKNTMAFNTTTFGEVINISEGGLRIKFLPHYTDRFETVFKIGLLSSQGDYYLDNLPCIVVSIKDSSPLQSTRTTFVREAGIKFTTLSADQRAKLSLFLEQNTIPHA